MADEAELTEGGYFCHEVNVFSVREKCRKSPDGDGWLLLGQIGKRRENTLSLRFPMDGEKSFFDAEAVSEVESEPYTETYGTVSSEVVQAHLVIERRLEGDVSVEEEGVTHFHRNHEVIVVGGKVVIFGSCTEKNTVLREEIAGAGSYAHVVDLAGVVVADVTLEHPAVGYEITGFGIEAQTEFFVVAVGKPDSRKRGTDVFFAFFKLGAGAERGGEQQQEGQDFFHDSVVFS